MHKAPNDQTTNTSDLDNDQQDSAQVAALAASQVHATSALPSRPDYHVANEEPKNQAAPASSEQVQSGWQFAPTEPTELMIEAGIFQYRSDPDRNDDGRIGDVYRAMLAVAPGAAAPATRDWLQYDAAADVLEIHGIRYAHELFSDFARVLPEGQPFKIISRANGVLCVERVAAPGQDEPGIAAKSAHWFAALSKCARLLNLPDDEPIPSGVVAAVERVTKQPTTPAAASDKALLDALDAWIKQNKAAGYYHFVFSFNTESTAREQIAADDTICALMKTATNEGEACDE